jgi:hypothetical protein
MYIHLARFIAVNDTVRISDAHFIQGDPKAYNLYGDNLRGNLIFIRIRGDMLLKTRQVSMAWALMANQLLEYGRRLAHAAYGNDAEVIIPKEFEGYERDWRDLEQRVAALPIVIERDHPVSLAVVASPDLYVGERPYLNPDSPAGSPSEVSDQLSRADEIENMVAKTQAHFEYHTDSGQGVSVPVSIKPPVPLRLELGTAKE